MGYYHSNVMFFIADHMTAHINGTCQFHRSKRTGLAETDKRKMQMENIVKICCAYGNCNGSKIAFAENKTTALRAMLQHVVEFHLAYFHEDDQKLLLSFVQSSQSKTDIRSYEIAIYNR